MPILDLWSVEPGLQSPIAATSQREQLRWQDPITPLNISLICTAGTSFHRFRLGDDLVVDALPNRRIIVHHAPDLAKSTVDHFIADQVYPRLLADEGLFVVHSGAVRLGSSAVMIMGHSGRGKSTLTASFDRAGHALLGDDAMVVSSLADRPVVRAVYRSLRLFPDSIDALMPGADTAGPVAHFTTKERIDVAIAGTPADAPVRVAAMFALAAGTDDATIVIRSMSAAETCMVLVESSFALDPSDIDQARRRLDDASALARSVPAYEIAYPRDYARLPEVRQAILDHVAALEAA